MVILRSVPPDRRIAVMKELGDTVPQLDLQAAHALVENTPCEILQGFAPRAAEAAARRLQALGADVQVLSGVYAEDRPTSPGPNAHLAWSRGPILQDVPPNRRIAAIRVLRENLPGLGLKEAQEMVAETPCEIPIGGNRELGEKVAWELRGLGVAVLLPGDPAHEQMAARVDRLAPMPTLAVPPPPARTRIGLGAILAVIAVVAAILWLLKHS